MDSEGSFLPKQEKASGHPDLTVQHLVVNYFIAAGILASWCAEVNTSGKQPPLLSKYCTVS